MSVSPDLLVALSDPARPCFLFGCTPPREGTSDAEARRVASLFAARSAALATDGFVVYDIQDESVRTSSARPFPFRKTMDAAHFASFFFSLSGKRCTVYKSVSDASPEAFDEWLTHAATAYGHSAFTLVGAPSSAAAGAAGLTLLAAFARARRHSGVGVGAVAIAERHTIKGNEHENMLRKSEAGASWFITQGIFNAAPIVRLVREYGEAARRAGVAPRKVVLTFAPVGRRKTLEFIKWLGMAVPPELEARVFGAASPVAESLVVLSEVLGEILIGTAGSGVPLGLNVESVSIVKEEIDAAHTLFATLQAQLLNARGSPWAVRWFSVSDSLAEGEAARVLGAVRRDIKELADAARETREAAAASGGAKGRDLALVALGAAAPAMIAAATLGYLLGRRSRS